jgi:hypothetical protein
MGLGYKQTTIQLLGSGHVAKTMALSLDQQFIQTP